MWLYIKIIVSVILNFIILLFFKGTDLISQRNAVGAEVVVDVAVADAGPMRGMQVPQQVRLHDN